MFRDMPKPNRNIGTEWDAIQRRIGNLPALEEESDSDEDRDYTEKSKSEEFREKVRDTKDLSKLEDDAGDDDDESFFEKYRQKRIAEMKSKAEKEIYGTVEQITESEYKAQVETKDTWVVVHLYKAGIPKCQLMTERIATLAKKFPATKFVKIFSDEAIHNYPDKNLPTLLIYRDGEMKGQFVGLGQLRGESMTASDLEWALSRIGVVKTTMEEDPRGKPEIKGLREGYVSRRRNIDDDDDVDDEDI